MKSDPIVRAAAGSEENPSFSDRRMGPDSYLGGKTPANDLLARAVQDAFGLEVNGDEARESIREALEWALNRRAVRPDEICAPPIHIFSLGLQAMKYSPLRIELVFMLASSLDSRLSHRVLPSHIEVLKQLSRDEFELLKNLASTNRGSPSGHANIVTAQGLTSLLYRHVLVGDVARCVEHKDNIPQYLDNLERLGLVSVSSRSSAPDSVYRTMASYKFLSQILEGTTQTGRIAISPHSVSLTDFGKCLRALCT